MSANGNGNKQTSTHNPHPEHPLSEQERISQYALAAAAIAQDWKTNPRWKGVERPYTCLLYTSPSPRDRQKSRMPSSA